MKIIEGKFAGMRIQYQEQKGTRVTSDKVRKSVFDVLKNLIYIEDIKVADLFCGSGMYGIESISRGAKEVVFVDESTGVIDNLRKNIKILDSGHCDIKIVNKKFEKFIKTCDEKFDLVFADPPYHGFDYRKFDTIYSILSDGGFLVLEGSKRVGFGELCGLESVSEKKYGDTKTYFFKKIT